eukprot:gene9124-9293_t
MAAQVAAADDRNLSGSAGCYSSEPSTDVNAPSTTSSSSAAATTESDSDWSGGSSATASTAASDDSTSHCSQQYDISDEASDPASGKSFSRRKKTAVASAAGAHDLPAAKRRKRLAAPAPAAEHLSSAGQLDAFTEDSTAGQVKFDAAGDSGVIGRIMCSRAGGSRLSTAEPATQQQPGHRASRAAQQHEWLLQKQAKEGGHDGGQLETELDHQDSEGAQDEEVSDEASEATCSDEETVQEVSDEEPAGPHETAVQLDLKGK